MLVSARADYAVRAVTVLAGAAGRYVTADAVAGPDMPKPTVELVLGELRRAGVVRTRRGAAGGYALAVDPEELTVGHVVRLVDGAVAPTPVGASGGGIPARASCAAVAALWDDAAREVSRRIDRTTVADLLRAAAPGPAGDRPPGQRPIRATAP